MKNLFTLFGLFIALTISAQDSYFTIYNFTVSNENVGTVYSLMDDYFSANKPEGVTVSLYENHFNDSENNSTHAVAFTGTLDAMGNMYGGGENPKWQLFLTRTGMHTKGFSSAMGRIIASFGDVSTPHPVQKYFLYNAEDWSAYDEAYEKYNSEHNPDGRITTMGGFSSGHAPDGVDRWVINSFKDFKSAMAGAGGLRNEADRAAHEKARSEYRNTRGEVKLVRSGLRILLGQW